MKKRRIVLWIMLFLLIAGVFVVTETVRRAPKIDVRAVYEKYAQKDDYVPYDKLPPKLIDVTLAAEDHRFYRHHGIDYIRVVKAVLRDLYHGAFVDGASTIPMQLSKNFLTNNTKSFERKLFDAHYARELERKLTKEELVAWYINSIGLSRGVEGVPEGARKFLGKAVDELSIAECAYLVGITNHPSRYTPFTTKALTNDAPMVYLSHEHGANDPETVRAMIGAGKILPELETPLLAGKLVALGAYENPETYERERYILRRMKELGMIDEAAYDAAIEERMTLNLAAFQKEAMEK